MRDGTSAADTMNIRQRLFGRTHSNDPTRDCPPPVFLHGGWRCGSTYIWNRFRESAQTMCFYEPFHETLARCTRKQIARDTTLTWNSRHPELKSPYWHEYLPLLRMAGLRGVRGHRDAFAVAEYFPQAAAMPKQVDYLWRLIEEARRQGKRAVFGFSRSLARAPALKRAFGGWHFAIRRNPRQQWLSCRSYRVEEGAAYFELCHFLILALAPVQSPAGRYARYLGLPCPPPAKFREQFRFMQAALGTWSDELSYRAFLAVNQLSQDAAASVADLSIDIDRLTGDSRYRTDLRGHIFARTGLEIPFDDCRIGGHDTGDIPFDFAAVESDVLRLLRACGANVRTPHERSPVSLA